MTPIPAWRQGSNRWTPGGATDLVEGSDELEEVLEREAGLLGLELPDLALRWVIPGDPVSLKSVAEEQRRELVTEGEGGGMYLNLA